MEIIKRILLGVLSLFFVLNADAQIGLEKFNSAIEKRAVALKRSQNSKIKKFMKYGYMQKPYLQNDSIKKTPIYRIFNKQELFNKNITPDSLFVYLNPKRLTLDEVFFYRGDSCINIGYPQYDTVEEQAIGVCCHKISEIAKYINENKPKLVFSWANYNVYFILNNDSSLTCFLLNDKRNSYIKLTPEELINLLKQRNISNSKSFYLMSDPEYQYYWWFNQ